MIETAQKEVETEKLYDADAEQSYILTIEDDNVKYEITQIYNPVLGKRFVCFYVIHKGFLDLSI